MTTYFIGNEESRETRYILQYGSDINQSEYDELVAKYFKKGYDERMVGFYDKWYRYNTEFAFAYDKGVMAAVESGRAVPDCQIISCIESEVS